MCIKSINYDGGYLFFPTKKYYFMYLNEDYTRLIEFQPFYDKPT